ncbi:chemotaxis protein [uncultured Pseudomonas sp.]|uniref:chemotaxis protein n=1 Tax=uncultured Pseudomonas sp. TaxID=114707 RepID=UPI00204AC400|nr:chemotaxis protein [uncultured Pseudomonas sp.]DAM66937.1 MAG TPA: major outer membrane lipoprotein [Caudoviricetes sp.]
MDPNDLGPGTFAWLGGTGTVLLGGLLWLRKFLSKDATDRAMDSADIGTVRRLNELLDSERLRANAAEARADQFAKERNDAVAAVGRMEGKIEALTSQVAQLTQRVTEQSDEINHLRTRLGGAA